MKRRGFFGLMGGAVVAGPSIAKTAIASGFEGLSIGGTAGLGQLANAGFATDAIPFGDVDDTDWATQELANFLGRSAADRARERLETHVDRLDPDIACMQSIALQAKIRMQRDRNFERNQAQHRGWLERQVQSAIKRFTS